MGESCSSNQDVGEAEGATKMWEKAEVATKM